jgi:hypothetical protein
MLELVTRSPPFPRLDDNISVALAVVAGDDAGAAAAPPALRADPAAAALFALVQRCSDPNPRRRIALDACFDELAAMAAGAQPKPEIR